jgi:two-component system sensor histidine kinase GlrK
MRVSTRIVSGFGVLLLVAVGTLGYQVYVIYQMQAVNQTLSDLNFSAARLIQQMEHSRADVKDLGSKYFVLHGDEVYEKEVEKLKAELSTDIVLLRAKAHTSREQESIDYLSKLWTDFWTLWDVEKTKINPESDEVQDMPATLRDSLEDIRIQTDSALLAVLASIQKQVNDAAASGARARKISFTAGGASLLIALIVALYLVRAIADPLRQVTQGTRRISKGQFWHRLPADSRDEFGELARDFNAMAQRLSELDQMKKDFVSHVSHELKAPLASMRQVFLLLLQEIAGPLNEQQRKLLRLSSISAERLTSMVGNLLDVSRLEAGTMEYDIHACDVAPLVRSVAEEFEVQAQEKGIKLQVEVDQPAWAQCDRDRIVQVIGNLFENALKFAPGSTPIIVRVQRTEDRKVLVSVIDSGTGVADEHKTRIFEKFHQVKRGKKISGQGVGLGLAICKTIVEAHNGNIWVEDNPGGGSIFSFALLGAVPTASTATDSVAAGQTR